ncbi:hypothetical protein Poli38472_009482 [Pythium oligandrum]|uniref:Uncharacterized protein n=1 Tax=Pythium oligandrum TaxID=41045 RepID=A0A8K1CEJ0_PYTOL|nr:hypothetical protein Poli38472_009482 [Pythium oligandrum]|eukprot:TMW61989.1 hypothetical protein Poli38472_009482 [Pythium oligandrum]
MIKTKPPMRPKVKSEGGGGLDGAPDKHKGATSGGAAAKKRRQVQKKKEADADGERKRPVDSVAHSFNIMRNAHEDRRYYQRAPRLLPEISGVKALNASEIQGDIKRIQSALNSFEAKMTALLPPGAANPLATGGGYLNGNKESSMSIEDAYGSFMFQKRRARPNGVITPEEVVESLPVCRRAVRITQRELAAMKRERDDLERDYMRLRCKLIWQIGEMKRIQKQQDRVMRLLSKDVVEKAKTLESSRRRTNALQDIMTELETRGSAIVRLTREKHQLETLMNKHGFALPEVDEIYIGDRVECQFGKGRVKTLDDVARLITVDLDQGGVAFVQEEHVEVLPSDISYVDAEIELKQKFFDRIGKLVQSNGIFGGSGRRRTPMDMDDSDGEDVLAVDEDSEEEEDDDDDDEEDDGEEDELNRVPDIPKAGTVLDDASSRRKTKKRKLMMPPSSASAKKKPRSNSKLFDFTACRIPTTPYDSGLLLSPLSELPDRVAAVGPGALQWMTSYLPGRMAEWEQDRYNSLQMQGEVERLRFQLQRAEAEKRDAQKHAADQLDSINQLVLQLDKLREQLAVKDAKKEKDDASSSTSPCPNCSSSSATSNPRKAAAASRGLAKANGRGGAAAAKKAEAANRRQRADSMEHDGSRHEDEGDEDGRDSKHDDSHPHDDEESDEGGESSDASKPTTRSLRPRRASGATPSANTTTGDRKPSK